VSEPFHDLARMAGATHKADDCRCEEEIIRPALQLLTEHLRSRSNDIHPTTDTSRKEAT
jgi:hypothetical protein